jgi:hypothetical protein
MTRAVAYLALGFIAAKQGKVIDYLLDWENRRVAKEVNDAVVGKWIYEDQLIRRRKIGHWRQIHRKLATAMRPALPSAKNPSHHYVLRSYITAES